MHTLICNGRAGIKVSLIALCLLLAGGCAHQQPYAPGYAYSPQPAVVDIYKRGSSEPPMTVLARVLGVRQADAQRQIPYSLAIRLRLENNSAPHATLNPQTLELVTGTLRAFPLPVVMPPQKIELTPGQRQDITAYFPFPAGVRADQMALDNLRLRWEIQIDQNTVQQSAQFQRISPAYNYDTSESNLYY